MAEPKIVTIDSAAKLIRSGLFAGEQLVGVNEHGHAIYCHDTYMIVRPAGPRPAGVEPYRRSIGGI